jgi:hypothetical protein
MPRDLNKQLIRNRDGEDDPLKDFSTHSSDRSVQVYFKDIESHLLRHIAAADVVVGCVAWLTSTSILKGLARKKGVSIIVQKEDFLRPDSYPRGNWALKQRELYKSLPAMLTRYDSSLDGTAVHMMSYCGDPTIDAVRCVGGHNARKHSAFPRAHHKFIVLCKETASTDSDNELAFSPYEVWTGSYNFTQNAARSFENAIVLKDTKVVNAFFQEWAQIAALSEPLDWDEPWVRPQWRIGS